MGDCLNCPLKIRVEQIETRQEKFEKQNIGITKSQTETLIWQAKIEQKFIAVEEGISRIEKAIDTRLKPMEDGINSIKDKPIKRLDAVTLAGIVAVVTAFINIAIKITFEMLKT